MRPLRLQTILAATDLTGASDAALESATRLAAAAGATLHLVHVVPSALPSVAAGIRAERERDVRSALRRAGAPDYPCAVNVVGGDPGTAIGALANRLGADVVVLGRRGEQVDGRPIGGTAYAVITNTSAPCLVVTTGLNLPMDRSLVAVDCSETARGALLVALSWSAALRKRVRQERPRLTVLHVDTSAPEDAAMRESIDREMDVVRRIGMGWADVDVQAETVPDANPVAAILRRARELGSELVVLGTRGLGSATSLGMGSVAAAVARELAVPVMLVPPAVWKEYARDLDDLYADHLLAGSDRKR